MEQKTKNIIHAVVWSCLAIILIVGGIIYAKFGTPTNHNESLHGVYKIRLDGWDGSSNEQYRRWANETLPELNRLGPTFQIVSGDANVAVTRAEVVERYTECATAPAIIYIPRTRSGQNRILIDPVCTNGELEFKTAFMHEIGHSLGMGHICRISDNRNDCSPIGRGQAVMNPSLLYEQQVNMDQDSELERTIGPQPTWQLQSLDLKEFCRVRSCRR